MGYEFVLKFYKWQYRSAQERFYFISTINSNCLEFLLTNSISSYNSSKIVWERRFSLGKSRPIPSSIDAEYQNWGLSNVMILTIGMRHIEGASLEVEKIVSITTLSTTPTKSCKCQCQHCWLYLHDVLRSRSCLGLFHTSGALKLDLN